MRLHAFLAWRFLFSRHRSGFVRLLTYLSILSIGLALSAFVIVMAVMNGFDRDLQARIIASVGAVKGYSLAGNMAFTAELREKLLGTKGVTEVTPELRLSALIRAGETRLGTAAAREAEVYAVPLDLKTRTSHLAHQMDSPSRLPAEGEILLGSALAERLGVKTGDRVEAVMLFPSVEPPFAETAMPVRSDLRVSGTFRTGYYEADQATAIVPAASVRKMFGLAPALSHMLEIGVEDAAGAADVAKRLDDAFSGSGLYFLSWRDLRAPLFRAVQLEKRVMALILSLFGLIAVFSVLSALSATAVEKRRELAALRAMGMTRGDIARILVTAGGIAGALGVALGAILSVSGHLAVTQSEFFRLPSEIYDLDRLPSEWSTALFAGSAAALFLLSILASLVPAVIQARKSPSVALREE